MTVVLGIETSCDETSAAVVVDGRTVQSNVVASQIDLHAVYGGVVPEIASRQHVRAIVPVVERALIEAGIGSHEVDLVAATRGPGLAGALLVGLTFGRALAAALERPFVPVNHLEGHIHSVWLQRADSDKPAPAFPMLTLIVSGGHTELVLVRDHGAYELIGRTLDDAAGEAFDKVARLLGLAYPGGPSIQAAATAATAPVQFPRAWLPGTHNFSFSGLKTAALHLAFASAEGRSADETRGRSLPRADIARGLTADQIANIAAGFQQSVVDVLARKTLEAAAHFDVKSICVVGGVAANAMLKARMTAAADRPLYIAPPVFCTDNGAMIASAGYFVQRHEEIPDVAPSLSLPVG